jgi:hypothetical protein
LPLVENAIEPATGLKNQDVNAPACIGARDLIAFCQYRMARVHTRHYPGVDIRAGVADLNIGKRAGEEHGGPKAYHAMALDPRAGLQTYSSEKWVPKQPSPYVQSSSGANRSVAAVPGLDAQALFDFAPTCCMYRDWHSSQQIVTFRAI